jgi:Flp pilus assembly protein TadD
MPSSPPSSSAVSPDAVLSESTASLASTRPGRLAAYAVAVAVALVTTLVFLPVLHADWVDWDDPTNFLNNTYYRGLEWAQLRWMLTANLMGHWIPVTWVTLGLDYVVWGMNPVGYHLTSLLWHAATAGLFFLVARRLLGLGMPSASPLMLGLGATAAALFFAIHPLRVESVAWITERRDLTSGFFLFLTVLAYLNAHERRDETRPGWWLIALVSAALALGSKAITMGLPLVLVILDFYPLRRIGPTPRDWIGPRARPVWLEKIPFILLAAAAAAIAFSVQRSTGYLTPASLATRLAITAHNVWFHAWKTFVPLNLSPVYELPLAISPLQWPYLLSAFAVLTITVAVWLLRRRWPAGLATWAFYLVMLAPVSGLVHTGYHLGADRNTYSPCGGFAVLVGALVILTAQAWQRSTLRPVVAAGILGLFAVWIVGLGLAAGIQTAVWRDSETLWRYAVEIDPTCSVCQHNLGVSVGRRGNHAEGLAAFERAIALRPDRSEYRGNYGILLMEMGRRQEGLAALRYRIEDSPRDLGARRNYALALIQDGRPAEAVAELESALRIQPDWVPALDTLGQAYLMLGRVEPALAVFRRAIAASPKDPIAHLGLARSHLAAGDRAAARERFAILKTIDPGLAAQVAQEFQ